MIKHPTKPIAVHTWDWKAQPDWGAITKVMADFRADFNSHVSITEVETGSDEYAIVIHGTDLTEEQASQAYEQHYSWEDGEDPDLLDWIAAEDYIEQVRGEYFKIGVNGIPALNTVINPLYIRFAGGERTFDLFESIMNLK